MKHILLFSIGLSFSFPLSGQVLFPGDLNNDGRANYLDLLAVGIAFGSTGPVRTNASFDWVPQSNEVWGLSLPMSGVDLSFCDANGDGLIDSLDIEAIAINYDSTQMGAIPPPMPYILTDTFPVEERPQIQLRFEQDSVLQGSTVTLIIDYIHPPQLPPTAAALGIAFALEYDESLVRDSLITFSPASDADDLMFVAAAADFNGFWRSVGPGRVEIAAVGRGFPALDRSRELGRVEIVIEDMVFFQPPPSINLIVTVEDFLLINPGEQVIDLSVQSDTLVIYNPIDNLLEQTGIPVSVELFPNPAREWVNVQVNGALVNAFALLNSEGIILYQKKTTPVSFFEIELKNLPRGLYFLEIQSTLGRLSKSLLIP